MENVRRYGENERKTVQSGKMKEGRNVRKYVDRVAKIGQRANTVLFASQEADEG